MALVVFLLLTSLNSSECNGTTKKRRSRHENDNKHIKVCNKEKSINESSFEKKYSSEHCTAHVHNLFHRKKIVHILLIVIMIIKQMKKIFLTSSICLVNHKTHHVNERIGSLFQHRSTNHWFYCCIVTCLRVLLTSRVYVVEV